MSNNNNTSGNGANPSAAQTSTNPEVIATAITPQEIKDMKAKIKAELKAEVEKDLRAEIHAEVLEETKNNQPVASKFGNKHTRNAKMQARVSFKADMASKQAKHKAKVDN